MLIVIICVMAVVVGVGSYQFFGGDNPIEESSEAVIKQQTGVDVDLSPNSPENGPRGPTPSL